jgi:hypothetical protein
MHQRLHHADDIRQVVGVDRVSLAPDAGYSAHGQPVDVAWVMTRNLAGTKQAASSSHYYAIPQGKRYALFPGKPRHTFLELLLVT